MCVLSMDFLTSVWINVCYQVGEMNGIGQGRKGCLFQSFFFCFGARCEELSILFCLRGLDFWRIGTEMYVRHDLHHVILRNGPNNACFAWPPVLSGLSNGKLNPEFTKWALQNPFNTGNCMCRCQPHLWKPMAKYGLQPATTVSVMYVWKCDSGLLILNLHVDD